MDRNPAKIFHLKTLIGLLQDEMTAKTAITPVSFLRSTYFLLSAKCPGRQHAKKKEEKKDLPHWRAGVPVKTKTRFDYTIQGQTVCQAAFVCGRLWKLKHLQKSTKSGVCIAAAHENKDKAPSYLQS